MLTPPQTLALDFDGVLCDGLLEYFQTSWRTYRQVWPTSTTQPPEHLAEQFYRLRPVIASGWEMPVLLRAILKGYAESEVFADWSTLRQQIVAEEDINPQTLGNRVDHNRDQWISEDLEGWLALHRFYPGVLERLQSLLAVQFPVVIITTKETRFVAQLLQEQQIDLPQEQIFGKDRQLPKAQILQDMQSTHPQPTWFVEDLLPTLVTVKQKPQLESVGLFLADWGYNTPQDHKLTDSDPRLHLLTLSQFGQDFSAWE